MTMAVIAQEDSAVVLHPILRPVLQARRQRRLGVDAVSPSYEEFEAGKAPPHLPFPSTTAAEPPEAGALLDTTAEAALKEEEDACFEAD